MSTIRTNASFSCFWEKYCLGVICAFQTWYIQRDYHVRSPLASEEFNRNQQVFSIPLFHKWLAAIQRSYSATEKIGVQGLRKQA